MNKQLFQQKIKAFGWHLLFSAVSALLSILLVYGVWYPSPLAKAVGVNHLYLMMLAIDAILGPVLTFIVYKKPKKTLRFDLAVILSVQLLALGYGLYTMYQGKPAWIAYDVDRFQLVRTNDIDQRKLAQAKSEYKHVPVGRPKYVASVVPKTNIELSNAVSYTHLRAHET